MEQRNSSYDADILVLGAGPAGYVAAIRAAQLGAKTVIVEKGEVGGTCLNVGCIPTKALLACVETLERAKHGADFGVEIGSISVDVPKMMERKNTIVKTLTSGVAALLKKNKVRLVSGEGRLVDANTVEVTGSDGVQRITSKFTLIATGSVPSVLPLPGFEFGENVWSSTEALEFSSVPKSILIVGAGAIGLEAAHTFANLGSDVTVVEMMPQILPAADTEIAAELQKNLEKSGIKFRTNAGVGRAEATRKGKKVFVKTESGEETFEVEKILVAVGRRAVIGGIGLDEVGVKHDGRKIVVDEHMRTSVPGIYAAGDVIGEPMLAHVAWTESAVAVEHAMGLESKMDYSAFPACVYTSPECASVGLTEKQARARHRDVRIGKMSFAHNGKAMGIGENHGFVKIISAGRFGQVLGFHVVGPHATDLITEAVVAMRNELTVDELIASIHPHPTLSEVVQDAALDVYGRAIHK